MLKTTMILATTMAVLNGAQIATAGEPTQNGMVFLVLSEGVAAGEPGDKFTRDMELELTLRDGKFAPKVWGYSMSFNKAFHDGDVVSADGDKLVIKLKLNPDRWYPSKPGAAEYQLNLQRQGDSFTGTFTGTLTWVGGAGAEKREVKGKITGQVGPSWAEPVAGFKKLEPNEHPRLIFRKSDLPVIKQRLETPEGKAILERFLNLLPKDVSAHPKTEPYYPAGYALAYQLTGDKAHADKAKALIGGMFDLAGSQDIHYGPMAQAMAVTLDLCYDAWPPEFRQKVIDNLASRLAALHAANMGGVSLNPYHNHEAIRVSGTGLAALCLLGEKTSNGKEVPDLDRIIQIAALATRRYFLYNGTSGTGWGVEGDFYKRMTWNSGPGHVAQAYRTALGGNLLAGDLGAWSILGEWMWLPPAEKVVASEGVRSDQDSGLFIFGLTAIPDSMKAGARWLFDRSYGLEGDKTFNMLWAYHAGYLLMNYPFDVPAKPPGDSLPWVAPDPTGGHWIFRRPWQGADDTLVVLNPRFDNPGGTHWIAGKSWDMQLFALGKLWIGDPKMEEKSGAAGAALPTTGNPQAFTDNLSAKLLDWSAPVTGKATLAFDMSPIYMRQLGKGEAPPAGQKAIRMSRVASCLDLGIKGERHVAIDLTGTCGAPVLLAFVDKFSGMKDLTWNLKLAKEAGAATVEGNTVTVGDPAGANMKVTFVGAKTPTLTSAIKATGSDEYFVVITVQNGAAPAVKADGDTATVGGQTVRFDGKKLVLAK